MTPTIEKKCLQIAVAVACLVPLSAGFIGAFKGASWLGDGNINLDSHFRYLSGLLLGIGISIACMTPHIERHSAAIRLLTIIVFIGGLCRLWGLILVGIPGPHMVFGLCMELLVTPLICLWQHRVAKRLKVVTDPDSK